MRVQKACEDDASKKRGAPGADLPGPGRVRQRPMDIVVRTKQCRSDTDRLWHPFVYCCQHGRGNGSAVAPFQTHVPFWRPRATRCKQGEPSVSCSAVVQLGCGPRVWSIEPLSLAAVGQGTTHTSPGCQVPGNATAVPVHVGGDYNGQKNSSNRHRRPRRSLPPRPKNN